MYKIYVTKTFSRKLKTFLKKHPELETTISNKFNLLIKNPFDIQLRTHKLSGALLNEHAISLTYEYRILFIIQNEDEIYLTNIGLHDEVY
jgi:mRNA-degrading endonuclease YafQ of YafQ-DinJ toxin-antitoxin module